MSEYNRDKKKYRVFAFGYGAKGGHYSKMVKISARSALEAGTILAASFAMPHGQEAHFLVDSADKDLYKRVVAAGSGRPPIERNPDAL